MVKTINWNSSLVSLNTNMMLNSKFVVEMINVLYLKCLITSDTCLLSLISCVFCEKHSASENRFLFSPNSISKPQALVMNKKLWMVNLCMNRHDSSPQPVQARGSTHRTEARLES
jgi:hypothetical protein